MSALEKYEQRVEQANTLLCVGLDSDLRFMPRHFRDDAFPQFAFNRWVIEQTCRSGAWPVAAAPRSTAASKALTAVQLEERLGRLEQRLEQRFDQLETLIALIGQAIAAPQQD